MIYKLHYAEKELIGDINPIKFKTNLSIYNYVINLIGKDENTVYLLAIDDEVIVTENLALIMEIMSSNVSSIGLMEDEKGICNVFLQEYESYEDAYSVALSMKETSPMCYSDKESRMPISKVIFKSDN